MVGHNKLLIRLACVAPPLDTTVPELPTCILRSRIATVQKVVHLLHDGRRTRATRRWSYPDDATASSNRLSLRQASCQHLLPHNLPVSRLEALELLQFFLLLHPAQLLRDRKKKKFCLPANLVPAGDFHQTASRRGAEVPRFGFKG